MKPERLRRQERERRIRAFVENTIGRRKELPTVAEVCQAVGGSTTVVAPVLREYRKGTRRDERRPVEAEPSFNLADYREQMKRALELAEELAPKIRQGTLKVLNPADVLRTLREERSGESE